jgi:hypothetical protein
VSDRASPAEHLKMSSLTSDPSKPGTESTHLTGGTPKARCYPGRLGPVLDAT